MSKLVTVKVNIISNNGVTVHSHINTSALVDGVKPIDDLNECFWMDVATHAEEMETYLSMAERRANSLGFDFKVVHGVN